MPDKYSLASELDADQYDSEFALSRSVADMALTHDYVKCGTFDIFGIPRCTACAKSNAGSRCHNCGSTNTAAFGHWDDGAASAWECFSCGDTWGAKP